MLTPILATKLYSPSPRAKVVLRPRLLGRLNDGLHRKLTLVCAPAGFGKTTLVSEWLAGCGKPAAWLSLDEGDGDPARFLTYLVAALQTVVPTIGAGVLVALGSPQPPPAEAILTALLNEITTVPDRFILVLDDYHVVDAEPVDHALTFLLEHLPPRMHLVIATREDPPLPLPRLRARGQMTEVRAADLRFTPPEAAEFLEGVMGLKLSAEDVALLETRTEGWIAGLQLAALSLQDHQDASSFIKSFTGSHHFVLDYLLEEVLQRQPESVQTFLLRTSILERLCGSLCDAVLQDSAASGQKILEATERANLFIVPLDGERRWYRYHHLFAELLRQRLHQSTASATKNSATKDGVEEVSELHRHASGWYESNGLEVEAFHHAAAAHDIERAERLIQGQGRPLYVRGGVAPVLKWLGSLPQAVLDARPSLWVVFATALAIVGQVTRVEQNLQAAERAMQGAEVDDKARDLIGRIADLRALVALLAADPRQIDTIVTQSRRALEYLHPDNLSGRAATLWKLGLAHQFRGERAAAKQAHTEAVAISEASGNVHINILATTCLGRLQELDNQLSPAVQTYRRVLHLVGEPPGPVACEAYVGLARIFYQQNDLDAAERHGLKSVQLARQLEIDSFVTSALLLARLNLAQGDAQGAAAVLAEAEAFVRQHNFIFRLPDVAAAQVLALLYQGNLAAAAQLTQRHDLPLSRARVALAQGNTSAALAVLGPLRQHLEAKGWADKRLEVMGVQAVAHHARGDQDEATQTLRSALDLAEPEGFIRLFVDEGAPMAQLLTEAATQGLMSGYTEKLLAAFEAETEKREGKPFLHPAQSFLEPLSRRELEVLRLIAQGLSNREISERLFRALDTVKGHNRIIFSKLGVQSRTEAVARARKLGLL